MTHDAAQLPGIMSEDQRTAAVGTQKDASSWFSTYGRSGVGQAFDGSVELFEQPAELNQVGFRPVRQRPLQPPASVIPSLLQDLATVERQVEEVGAPIEPVLLSLRQTGGLQDLNLAGDGRRIESERAREHTEPLRPLVGELAHDCVGGPFECDVAVLSRQVDAVRTSQKDGQLLFDVLGCEEHDALPFAYSSCAPDPVSASPTCTALSSGHFTRISRILARGCPSPGQN